MSIKMDAATDRNEARPLGERSLHQPTEEQRREVREMARVFLPCQHVAVLTGVSETALYEHYGTELTEGAAEGVASLMATLRRVAEGGDRRARKVLAQIEARAVL